MNQSPFHADEDQESLFGSPPPSSARGRSPSQETFTTGKEVGPIVTVPSTGVGRKNVGTIALPGSHMSCAELPADLPASSLLLPYPTSSHNLPSPGIAATPIPLVVSRSSTRSVSSRASSAASKTPSASSSTGKRRKKAKSLTPALPVPPISFPGPDEPTPPNLLRSQSSLLGLAGLVGCVKPSQLYMRGSQSTPVQQSRSHSPICGSTPTHPIVLDDEQDTPHIGKHPCGELQTPRRLDQLNPEILRSNIMSSLAKEKNIFPVLESLIKLFGGEPHLPSANHPTQLFARPYGHGIFSMQPHAPAAPPSTHSDPTTPAVPPQKRRKLKHVPAGAADWDVPFPFAVGEGPEAYHETWARDRAKQLATQLLGLVQNATKRAAIKTAKSGGEASRNQSRAQSFQSSRSASVETQAEQTNSAHANVRESILYTSLGPERAMTRASSDVTLTDSPGPLETPNTTNPSALGSNDGMPDSECLVEEDGSAVPYDYSAFEEWLSQLQQFVPLEANASTLESNWATSSIVRSDSSASDFAPNTHVPPQRDTSTFPHAIRDEAIDPALLAMSQQAGLTSRSQSPTSPVSVLTPGDVRQVLGITSTPPVLVHSPRASSSSLTEPLTPLSEAFADVPTSTMMHQDLIRDPPTSKPVEQQPPNQVPTQILFPSPIEPSESPCITVAQKGKGRADISIASPAPSTSSRFTPTMVSTAKGVFDKQAILERARERRKELIAEIERAKMEIWETSIENAILVHFMRDVSSS